MPYLITHLPRQSSPKPAISKQGIDELHKFCGSRESSYLRSLKIKSVIIADSARCVLTYSFMINLFFVNRKQIITTPFLGTDAASHFDPISQKRFIHTAAGQRNLDSERYLGHAESDTFRSASWPLLKELDRKYQKPQMLFAVRQFLLSLGMPEAENTDFCLYDIN